MPPSLAPSVTEGVDLRAAMSAAMWPVICRIPIQCW